MKQLYLYNWILNPASRPITITIWGLLLMILTAVNGFAQVATYNYSTGIGSYNEITGGTVLFASGTPYDDNVTSNQTINPFVFNGVTVTTFSLNTNGWISLGELLQLPPRVILHYLPQLLPLVLQEWFLLLVETKLIPPPVKFVGST